MGKSNPSSHKGYPGAATALISNQFTAGGNKKAGLGRHIGMGQFTVREIETRGPSVSGLAWKSVNKTNYPVPNINQIGGVGFPRRGMFTASADGVNVNALNMGRAHVASGPRTWGL